MSKVFLVPVSLLWFSQCLFAFSFWERQDNDGDSCLYRRCSQVVTRRGTTYEVVLRSIQEEEYLPFTDFAGSLPRKKRQIIEPEITTPSSPLNQTSLPTFIDQANTPILPPNGPVMAQTMALGVSSALVAFAMSTLMPNNFIISLSAVNAPLPGTPGGGNAFPRNAAQFSSVAREALRLLPSGTTPVSNFPPYSTPRTLPAVCILFQEEPQQTGLELQSLVRGISLIFRRLQRWIRTGNTGNVRDINPNEQYGFSCNVTITEKCVIRELELNNEDACIRIEDVPQERQTGELFFTTAAKMCRNIRTGEC